MNGATTRKRQVNKAQAKENKRGKAADDDLIIETVITII